MSFIIKKFLHYTREKKDQMYIAFQCVFFVSVYTRYGLFLLLFLSNEVASYR